MIIQSKNVWYRDRFQPLQLKISEAGTIEAINAYDDTLSEDYLKYSLSEAEPYTILLNQLHEIVETRDDLERPQGRTADRVRDHHRDRETLPIAFNQFL